MSVFVFCRYDVLPGASIRGLLVHGRLRIDQVFLDRNPRRLYAFLGRVVEVPYPGYLSIFDILLCIGQGMN